MKIRKLPKGLRLPMPPPEKAFRDKKNDYKRKDKHNKKSEKNESFSDFSIYSKSRSPLNRIHDCTSGK